MSSLTEAQMKALSELVDKIKSGGAYDKDYVQVGGNPELLATFFNKLLSNLSKDMPQETKASIIASLKKKYPQMKVDSKWDVSEAIKNSLDTQYRDAYKWADRPNDFRRAIQRHVTDLPPQYQLSELNRIQKDCPFGLVDPSQKGGAKKGKKASGKRLTPKKMHYGFADLYKFLGFPYSDKPVRSSMQGQNPFYQPLEMPIPDVYANNVLTHIRRFSPEQKLMEAKEIYKEIMKKSGGGWMVSGKILDETYDKKIARMAELAYDVSNRVYSPVTLSHFVAGQERPMKSYQENDNFRNFNDMLWQLQKVHLIKPISSAPSVTNYSISESAMSQVQGRSASEPRKRRVVKKRSAKRSAPKRSAKRKAKRRGRPKKK